MARPAVQEAGFMGRVMVVAALVQDSKAIKPDMAIKVIRAIKEVITISGINSRAVGLSEQSEVVE